MCPDGDLFHSNGDTERKVSSDEFSKYFYISLPTQFNFFLMSGLNSGLILAILRLRVRCSLPCEPAGKSEHAGVERVKCTSLYCPKFPAQG
jgi:hypothetical protein